MDVKEGIDILNSSSPPNHLTSLRQYVSQVPFDLNLHVDRHEDGKFAPAHKILLVSLSPFLRDVMASVHQDKISIVLVGVKPNILKKVLCYLYLGVVQLAVGEGEEFNGALQLLGIHIKPDVPMKTPIGITTAKENVDDHMENINLDVKAEIKKEINEENVKNRKRKTVE